MRAYPGCKSHMNGITLDYGKSDISYEAVVQAIKLGNLGKQVVIKSALAYSQLVQSGDKLTISKADYIKYNRLYLDREKEAGEQLQAVRDIKGRTLDHIVAFGVE